MQEEVVLDAAMLTGGASGHVLDSGAAAGTASRAQLAAHRGFLTRARGVPIDSLYREARARGKRLVLCGHSLGGAVASLCALQLLQHLPPNLHHTVR
jgi:alpha-beta hydrolase superfamily lysophospholipase